MPTSADLNEVVVFARVVQHQSFTAAARELRMPKSTVSRKVTDLEERLGVRLLQRTTRTLHLTDEGRTYYDYCARILGELDDAERAVGRLRGIPRGLLRVTTPLNFDFLGPILADFVKKHAEVVLEVIATDCVVGLVEDGFDVAVRAGTLADSSLVARPLATIRRMAVASPSYVRKHGRPTEPRDLAEHDCVVFGSGTSPATWRFEKGGATEDVTVKARFVINDFDAVFDAAVAGVGVAVLPIYRAVAAVRERKLEHVLREWYSPRATVHAVYPSTRHLAPKVKAFVDFLQVRFTPPPWEVGPTP